MCASTVYIGRFSHVQGERAVQPALPLSPQSPPPGSIPEGEGQEQRSHEVGQARVRQLLTSAAGE